MWGYPVLNLPFLSYCGMFAVLGSNQCALHFM